MRLEEFLRERSESVTGFARRIDRDYRTVTGWMSGTRAMTIDDVAAIERATFSLVRAPDLLAARKEWLDKADADLAGRSDGPGSVLP
jgi:hypothetical protein